MPTGTHHYDAIQGLKAVVEGLGLDGITGANPLPDERVYTQELLTYREGLVTLPCVIVSKAPMPEAVSIEDNQANLVGYPCLIAVLVAANQDPTLTEGPARWRQEIEDAVNLKEPPELAAALSLELSHTEWMPLDCVDLERFHADNLIVNAGIVVVHVYKPR